MVDVETEMRCRALARELREAKAALERVKRVCEDPWADGGCGDMVVAAEEVLEAIQGGQRPQELRD